MKNKEIAFEALKIEVNESNTFWDSYDALDELLPSFITGEADDVDWLNNVINFVGHDYYMFRIWFGEQLIHPNKWTASQLEVIEKFNNILKTEKNGKK